jgi:nicotinate-nucleotide adenylyltransferase
VAAQDALGALDLDRVVLVPAAVPPHKLDRPITPGRIRLELLRAAVEGDARFEVDDVELRREGPSWTVDTLRALRECRPGAELFLLMGTDQFAELETWREPDEIRRLASIAVLARAGAAVPADADRTAVDVTRIDITSTEIRRRVAAGLPIRFLVPEPVEALIRRYGLYGSAAAPPPGTGPGKRG